MRRRRRRRRRTLHQLLLLQWLQWQATTLSDTFQSIEEEEVGEKVFTSHLPDHNLLQHQPTATATTTSASSLLEVSAIREAATINSSSATVAAALQTGELLVTRATPSTAATTTTALEEVISQSKVLPATPLPPPSVEVDLIDDFQEVPLEEAVHEAVAELLSGRPTPQLPTTTQTSTPPPPPAPPQEGANRRSRWRPWSASRTPGRRRSAGPSTASMTLRPRAKPWPGTSSCAASPI